MSERDLTKCPACHSAREHYLYPSDEVFETWVFGCGAEVYRDLGKFFAEQPCRRALKEALAALNVASVPTVNAADVDDPRKE